MPETIIESVLNGKLDSALLTRWLNNESIDDAPDDCILHCCKRSEFVAYFLSFLRNQTDKILQTNTNALQIIQNSTPDKLLNRKHHRSISDPTNNDRITDNLSVKSGSVSQSPSRDRKRTGRKVKTKLFPDEKKDGNVSISSDESHLSTSIEKLAISSTPLKNGMKVTDYPNLSLASPLTPRYVKEHERCDTPRLHRHSRSQEKHCLGDYLVSATKQKKKSKKNASSDKEDKTELDLSNSDMFPEIGTRKSSSLRSEKRRIKPTNIDTSQKSISSVSLNSFTAECFQQPSIHALEDNSAFKQQNIETSRTSNFEAERNILKQERHKLMEKFNILNTSTPLKQATPQIKITQKESIDISKVYLKADVTKILMKDKIDYIINIYDSLMKNNLILSVNTEMYFLISILISKQCEDDYLEVQSKLIDNNIHYLLKSIDNCTYFAVKALWNERATLEVILDKNSLKTLGENKTLRSFYPELAKFLLNTYCLRCENVPVQQPVTSSSQTVVCYNIETDHVDNFSGMHAFHHFKKQRDMFYDIVRWYQSDRSLAPHPSLSRRVRSLLAAGGGSLSQLARLVVLHMMGACLSQTAQESKLSKLQRRLTCPSASDTNRLPHFTPSEMFYKEFLIYADNESFRVHFKDVLSSEILTLDSTHITLEDKGNSNTETSQEYIQLIKKLSLLAKFLGFTCAAPYSNYTDVNIKNSAAITSDSHSTPKERVLENSLAVRNYSQPSIDFKTVLQNAIDNHRLSITVPWLVQYLSMLDYTTLRLKYYSELLKKLHDIYLEKLKLTPSDLKMTPSDLKTSSSESKNSSTCDLRDVKNTSNSESKSTSNCDLKSTSNSDLLTNSKTNLKITPRKDLIINTSDTKKSNDDLKKSTSDLKKNTKIYLKSLLGWLFDLPHFPTDFQETSTDNSVGNEKIDSVDLVDESSILELCPSLKEVNILLSTCRLSSDRKENTFRHITPVSLNVNPEDRIKNKEKEMQSRLRAALLRAQPPSARRALELVASCACGAALADVARGLAPDAARARLTQRAAAALAALVPSAGAALRHVAGAAARERFHAALASNHASAGASFSAPMEVPKIPKPDYSVPLASHLITLKEHLCRVAEGGAGAAGAHAGPAPPGGPAGAGGALRAAAALAGAAGLARRPLASLALDLCLVYVAHRPSEVTASFLSSLLAVWHVTCPDRRRDSDRDRERERERERDREREREHSSCASPERAPTPDSDADVGPTLSHVGPTTSDGQTTSNIVPHLPNTSKNVTKLTINTKSTKANSRSIPNSPTLYNCVGPTFTRSIPTSPIALNPTYVATVVNNTTKVNTSSNEEELLDLFDRLLCCRNIVMLSSSRCEPSAVWLKMADVVVFLLEQRYLSEDSLTEQCLAVYRQDWPQSTLLQLSACMKAVAQRWANSTSGKFTLFLDFLAEYCGDLDYEH